MPGIVSAGVYWSSGIAAMPGEDANHVLSLDGMNVKLMLNL